MFLRFIGTYNIRRLYGQVFGRWRRRYNKRWFEVAALKLITPAQRSPLEFILTLDGSSSRYNGSRKTSSNLIILHTID